MEQKQKLIVAGLAAAVVALVAFASTVFVRNLCRSRFSENLILREKPRAESAWEIVETPAGSLVRMTSGPFRGWCLAADDLVNSVPEVVQLTFRLLRPRGAYAQSVILEEREGPGCYWTITAADKGVRFQPARGRYAGWYLGFQEGYVPDSGRSPRTAWNLILTREPQSGSDWKRTETDGGSLIQATAGPFAGWYLDCLHEANILERNRCWGEKTTRDRPDPPLAR